MAIHVRILLPSLWLSLDYVTDGTLMWMIFFSYFFFLRLYLVPYATRFKIAPESFWCGPRVHYHFSSLFFFYISVGVLMVVMGDFVYRFFFSLFFSFWFFFLCCVFFLFLSSSSYFYNSKRMECVSGGLPPLFIWNVPFSCFWNATSQFPRLKASYHHSYVLLKERRRKKKEEGEEEAKRHRYDRKKNE